MHLQLSLDDSHLQRRLRHRVADDMTQVPADGLRSEIFDVEEQRCQPAASDIDAGGHIFGGVERRDHRHGLSPPGDLTLRGVEDSLDEVAVLLRLPHERGLERGDERNRDLVEGD